VPLRKADKCSGTPVSRGKSVQIVLEGFGILILWHAAGGYFLAPFLGRIFSGCPSLVIDMLSSSGISPAIAAFYLYLRTRSVPRLVWQREVLVYMLAGIVLAWIITYLSILVFLDKDIALAQDIARMPAPCKYLLLFLLTFWGPVIEETLNRGFFFEILSKEWNRPFALLFSSAIFVVSHGIWGGFEPALILIFGYSVILTLLYIEAGLLVSVSTHMFINAYLFYLN